MKVLRHEGQALKFSPKVFDNFETLLTRQYTANASAWEPFRQVFFDDFIIEKNGLVTLITLAQVDAADKVRVYETLVPAGVMAFDRQMLTNVFAEYVHEDFNLIVMFTSLMVFLALLVAYGRIELTVITFFPMLITWIWILGLMALLGIEFNIVNVMISTFIFGLGDDYSIFIMDGLKQEYQYGKKSLMSIRTSIFLSALTTISGLGVLIFAAHPALRSIAGISIIGILCVFIMSQTVEPFLFRWLITRRTARGLSPMTLWGMIKTFLTYAFFIGGSFALTIIGLLLKIFPAPRRTTRLWFHTLLSGFTRGLIKLTPGLKLHFINHQPDTFSGPAVIISNHSSFLDILLTTMLHPKLILLTNKWVWNSPIFGGVVRLADYYPVVEGAEDTTLQMKDRVAEKYSIVVFPEGTRSVDGKIGRFHKGAFYMAEMLGLGIRPLLIHGASDSIPRNTMYVNAGQLTLKFLPPIAPDDHTFGKTYSERTKNISQYFKSEYKALAAELESPEYYKHRLIQNYLYKGPVLEWYLRVKLKLERYYQPFHLLVPAKAEILDVGCGYGFLSFMLHFSSPDRRITGIDYDDEKILTANNCFSKHENITFLSTDLAFFEFKNGYDVIIMADVLHYLTPDIQHSFIERSVAALNPGGRIIIREGNADLKDRHQGTRLTEFFSVTLFGFNKAAHDLHFISAENLKALAERCGCIVTVTDDTKFTSNVIFVLEKAIRPN
jgi:1-acyl-sn-glycerol-3-phosphate acyltransferase